MVIVEDVDYDKDFKEFVNKMKDIVTNEDRETRLVHGTDFQHDIVYPSNGSTPKHRFTWLNHVTIDNF